MNALGVEYASSSDDDSGDDSQCARTGSAVPPKDKSVGAITIDGLPAEPPGPADPQVQARIARFLEMQQTPSARSFQENLQTKKEVANPYILHKVVEYFGIDELQSNFPTTIFDPYGLPLHEYSDKIASEQKRKLDERSMQQQLRTQISFSQAKQT